MKPRLISAALLDFLPPVTIGSGGETPLWDAMQFSLIKAPRRPGRMYRLRAGGRIEGEHGEVTFRAYYNDPVLMLGSPKIGEFCPIGGDVKSWHLDLDVIIRLAPGGAWNDTAAAYVVDAYGSLSYVFGTYSTVSNAVGFLPVSPPKALSTDSLMAPTKDSPLIITAQTASEEADLTVGFISFEELTANPR